LPGFTPDEMAEGIRKIKKEMETHSADLQEMKRRVLVWKEAHGFSNVGKYIYTCALEKIEAVNFNN